ncbi:hypothetical protein [methane-oxidizing endosymbiont of Gigantopelta aegis]|uniref:hypothetical protein n=1 Tax=methane-oxidizing endosymbiont of Gigantopelta aegis TaxID=2794938 RepID=UPI0018DE9F7F|nr:hypothetical protein [methane-oxidizing endosymbiont of Gigantopelta aegis]
MKMKLIVLSLLMSFSGLSYALAVDEWNYKEVTGDLKPSPGCKDKEVAIKKVEKKPDSFKGYSRFKKYSNLLCENMGYGWTLDKVIDEGKIVCDECGGDYTGKYRCQAVNVTVNCKQVAR